MSDNLKWSNYDFKQIPFDNLVRVGQRTMLYRDLFTVSWLLGRFCNYRCSYCWPYARSDRKDHRPTDLCLATIDEIKRRDLAGRGQQIVVVAGMPFGIEGTTNSMRVVTL